VNILTTWSVQDELSQEIARFFLSSYGDEFSWDQSVSVFGGVGEGPLLKALMQRLSAVTQLSNNGQATAHSTAPSTAAAPNTSQAKRPGVATSSTSNSVTKRARLFRLLVALRSQQQHDAGPVLLVTATKHLKTLSARPLRDAVAANVDEIYTVSSDAQFASERLFSDDAAATAQSKLLEQDVLVNIFKKNPNYFTSLFYSSGYTKRTLPYFTSSYRCGTVTLAQPCATMARSCTRPYRRWISLKYKIIFFFFFHLISNFIKIVAEDMQLCEHTANESAGG